MEIIPMLAEEAHKRQVAHLKNQATENKGSDSSSYIYDNEGGRASEKAAKAVGVAHNSTQAAENMTRFMGQTYLKKVALPLDILWPWCVPLRSWAVSVALEEEMDIALALGTKAVAKALDISEKSAIRMVKDGLLPRLPIGGRRVLVSRAALEDFVRAAEKRCPTTGARAEEIDAATA